MGKYASEKHWEKKIQEKICKANFYTGLFQTPSCCRSWSKRVHTQSTELHPTTQAPTYTSSGQCKEDSPPQRWCTVHVVYKGHSSLFSRISWRLISSKIAFFPQNLWSPWHTRPAGRRWASVALVFAVVALVVARPVSLSIAESSVVREITLIGGSAKYVKIRGLMYLQISTQVWKSPLSLSLQ